KRQYLSHPRRQPLARRPERYALFPPAPLLPQTQTELQIEKLVEDHRAMRRRREAVQRDEIGRRAWLVQLRQCVGQRHETLALFSQHREITRQKTCILG